MKRSILILLVISCISLNARAADPNTPKILIQTIFGDIGLELFHEQAEVTVANFMQYVDSGYYNDIIFHRAIYGFIIQTGSYELIYNPDPPPYLAKKTDGLMGPIINESSNGLSNVRGSVAMALLPDEPNSATSSYYINHFDNLDLDGEYCVFGRVIGGMDGVDWIASLPTYTIDGLTDVPIFEYGGTLYWVYIFQTIVAPPGSWITSDLNNNGRVDLTDLSMLAGNWMAEGEDLTGDIDGLVPDGIVNCLDFAVMAGEWHQQTDWY